MGKKARAFDAPITMGNMGYSFGIVNTSDPFIDTDINDNESNER